MKQQESEVSGQGSGVEREPAVKGRDSGYLTRISVFLITLSGLILEVGLTRIYSASIWYHFAFVAISVALLGWGLGVLHGPSVEAESATVNRKPLRRSAQIWSELHRVRQEIADHDYAD